MPKIGKHSTIVVNTRHEVDINYGQVPNKRARYDPKKFWIKLPEAMANYTGKMFVDSTSEKGVTDAFDKIATDFYSKTSTTEKYIKLTLKYTMFKEGREEDDSSYRYLRFNEIYTFQDVENEFPQQTLTMEYEIGYLHKIGERYFFTRKEVMEHRHEVIKDPFRKEKRKATDSPEDLYLKWTPERETWVHNTYKSFARLINEIHTFYASSNDAIQELIANQQKVLTYGTEQPGTTEPKPQPKPKNEVSGKSRNDQE